VSRPVPDGGQQLELVVSLGTGGGGDYQQGLRLVRVEEKLAVQFEDAEFWVLDAFDVVSAVRP
jgi:hypothetical protein